ncbi:MAG: hypothetical protein MUE92_06390 [Chloroflexi bacterium]|nr:hypothetical protein [Chloroflexota bacterium]
MAERDRFELDLTAALRAYAEDAPTQVRPAELARQFATAYPHGRTSIGPWRLPTALRPAWVLLLLAGLLAALVGGTLLVGSQLQPRLPAVVPPVGQLFECPPGSTPDEPGPVDQARPTQPYTTAFDRRAGRLVALARSDWNDYVVETWTFDVCTNTWTRMHPNREAPSTDLATGLVYDVDADLTIQIAGDRVWAYNLQANTWTEQGVVPAGATLCAFDPLSGRVVAAKDAAKDTDPIELWNYDVETDTWTPIRQTDRLGSLGYGAYAYDASADQIIEFERGRPDETWLLDIRTGTWSRFGAEAPDLQTGLWTLLPAIVYDEAAERTVFSTDGRLASYDAIADRWEILIESDFPDFLPVLSVYDPVNGRLVGVGSGGTVGQGAVVAFDLETRQWTVLLDWSEEQPAPAGATLRPLDLGEGSPHAEP